MKEIVQVLTSLFECLKKENEYIISDINYLREKTNELIFDIKDDFSTLKKNVDRVSVENDNINQYEHGDELVVSRDINPHGSPTENCKDIVLNLF